MSDIIEEYAAGTIIFEQGDEGGFLYVIERGSIEIYRTVDTWRHKVAVLTQGDFFGEMSIVHQRPRSATAVAREDVRLLVIEEATLTEMLSNKVEIAARIIRTLATRLEQANRKLEILLLFSESRTAEPVREPVSEDAIDIGSDNLFDQALDHATVTADKKPLIARAPRKPPSAADIAFDELWSNVSDVIIDKDYDTALEYLEQAETMRPDDPRIPKYKRKLNALIEMAGKSYSS